MTAIPSNLVEQLGLVPVDSVLVSHGGEATAIERDVFAAAVDVPVLGRSIVRVLATADPFALLGRDLLNELYVVLDGPKLAYEIARSPGDAPTA